MWVQMATSNLLESKFAMLEGVRGVDDELTKLRADMQLRGKLPSTTVVPNVIVWE